MKSLDLKLPALTYALIGLIVVNIFQFAHIRNNAGEIWGALYEVGEDNVFREFERVLDETTVFGIFTELGDLAPEATIVTNDKSIFGPGKNARYKLIGMLDMSIEVDKSLRLDDRRLSSLLTYETPIKSGLHWTSVPHRVSGASPIEWEIYIKDENIQKFYFTSDDQGAVWLFIDERLLSENDVI